MSGVKVTAREKEFLRHLDWCCWENSERGGDGWCDSATFAESFGIGRYWARRVLSILEHKGLVETIPHPDRRKKLYAPSEAGSDLINSQQASLGGRDG